MSIFSRFCGKNDEAADDTSDLVANPKLEENLSLQLLFDAGVRLDSIKVTKELQAFHPSMARARAEIDPELNQEGKIIGLVGWGKHVIRLVGFDLPMPAEAVEACVAPSHYPDELKQRARAHAGHVLLFYAGYESSALEQYVALTAVATVLSRFGGIVVLNETARTSFPAAALPDADMGGDLLETLRELPLCILYCGFVKYEVEGVPGVWIRTYGAHLLGLPDFAAKANGHHESQRYFEIFENVFAYLRHSGARLGSGHTMQLGEQDFLRLRTPAAEEYFLESDGELLVVEIIGRDEINR